MGWKEGSEFRNIGDNIFKMLTEDANAQIDQFCRLGLLHGRI
jgi:hypothetical protein